MCDASTNHKGVILWEWVDRRGIGVMSGERFDRAVQAKLDERLDRIEQLGDCSHGSIEHWVSPFSGELKKIKIPGSWRAGLSTKIMN